MKVVFKLTFLYLTSEYPACTAIPCTCIYFDPVSVPFPVHVTLYTPVPAHVAVPVLALAPFRV